MKGEYRKGTPLRLQQQKNSNTMAKYLSLAGYSLMRKEILAHYKTHNPIILIPGILGSRLVDENPGEIVWGIFSGTYADPGSPEEARLVALPMREGSDLSSLRDSVRSDGALETVKVKILGLLLTLSAYVDILATLGIGGYRSEELASSGAVDYGSNHFTCFQFDYDWRRDNIENARLLHEFILKKRAYVQKEIEKRYGLPALTRDWNFWNPALEMVQSCGAAPSWMNAQRELGRPLCGPPSTGVRSISSSPNTWP